MRNALSELGWNKLFADSLLELGISHETRSVGRVQRIDRGWSTLLAENRSTPALHATQFTELRARNIGADIAVGDWVVLSSDGERVEHVLPRTSQLVRRASSDTVKAVSQVIAANVDVVLLVHALDARPNQRQIGRAHV